MLPWLAYVKIPQLIFDHPSPHSNSTSDTDSIQNSMGKTQSTMAKDVTGDIVGEDNLPGGTVDESGGFNFINLHLPIGGTMAAFNVGLLFLCCLLLLCCRPIGKRIRAIWRSGSPKRASATVAYQSSTGQIHIAAMEAGQADPEPAPVILRRQPTIKRLAPLTPVHQASVLPSAPPRYMVE